MPRIAYLFLANHAETRDGLLNVLGGGWNRHAWRRQPDGSPAIVHFAVVAGVAFDPTDTERQSPILIRIVSDQNEQIFSAEGQASIGEEPLPVTRLVNIAANIEARWPHPGNYSLVGQLGPGSPEHRFAFRVEEQTT